MYRVVNFTLYHEICIRFNLPYGPKRWPWNEYLTQILLVNGIFNIFSLTGDKCFRDGLISKDYCKIDKLYLN